MGTVLRALAAVAGGVLVLAAAASVVGTVVVPRAYGSPLTRFADWFVDRVVRVLERFFPDFGRHDALLALRAPAVLLMQLTIWLATRRSYYVLAMPLVAGVLWWLAITAGEAWFGWTG